MRIPGIRSESATVVTAVRNGKASVARIRIVQHVVPVVVVLGLAGFLYLIPLARSAVETVDSSVEAVCRQAGAQDRQTCVDVLMAELESGAESGFARQNQIIWTLGQLADPKALPVLRSLYTGEPCELPCDPSTHICQYELEKSIRWCRGEAWIMRGLRRVYRSPW